MTPVTHTPSDEHQQDGNTLTGSNDEINDINMKIASLSNQLQSIKNDEINRNKQDINTLIVSISALTANNARLHACTAPRVAFTVTFEDRPVSVSIEYPATMKYDKIILNTGDNYDVNTGIFTCTEPGVYSFSVYARAGYGYLAELKLRHNGNVVTSLTAWDDADFNSASMGANLILGQGDTVQVVAYDGATLQDLDQPNIFMGHMVHADACLLVEKW